MRGLQVAIVVGFVLLSCFLSYSHIIVSKKAESCNSSGEFLSQVFTYDSKHVEIARKDVLVAGKINKGKVPLLIGIPTVYREYHGKTAYYLDKTINALLNPLTEEEKKREVALLIILADREDKKREMVFKQIMKDYTREVQSGLITVIIIPDRYYQKLHDIPSTFNDSPERMYWRSKQSLDYAFIFDYVDNLCDYYMQIEDDVLADEEYYQTILEDIERLNRRRNKHNTFLLKEYQPRFQPWMVIEYYKTGFIGRVIPAKYLHLYSTFIKTFYDQIPVDWGYPHLIRMVTGKGADKMGSLFKHIGKQSSSLGT